MLEYQRVPQEREREVPDRKPPPEWPSAGVVEYRSVWMRYRDGLPPVLKTRRGRGWVRWEGVGLCRAARAASPSACCTSSPPRRRAGSRPLPGLWCRAQGVTFAVGSAEKVGRWAWWATRVRVSRAGRHVRGGQARRRWEGGHGGPPGLGCRAQGVTFAVGSAEKVGRWAWWATRVRVSRAGRHIRGGQRGEGGKVGMVGHQG
jgi:hypothetical protein